MKLRASYNSKFGQWSLLHDKWCNPGETSRVAQTLTSLDPYADQRLTEELARRWNLVEELTQLTPQQQLRAASLTQIGFIIGLRDYRINTDYPGDFMVVEPHTADQLPTCNGANGPWAVVGDNLGQLIDPAWEIWGMETPLAKAEDFISGFEDDELQEGIPELLNLIRKAIGQ